MGVDLDFAGGDISSNGGALLLAVAERRIGLLLALAQRLDDRRQAGKVALKLPALPRQRVFAVALGHEDVNDHGGLRNDPALRTVVGRAFHGYYDCYCFLPLYVFCGARLLVSYLGPPSIDGAKHAWAILVLLFKRPRAQWPGGRIVLRAGSGVRRHQMLTRRERHAVGSSAA